jgi:hypothetical protein
MTDGDVSHSSDIRLLSWRTGVGLDLFSRWFSFLLYLLVLRLDFYFLTSRASSPEWVKPTAEGGGLFLLFFAFMLLCLLAFYDFRLLVFVACMYLST